MKKASKEWRSSSLPKQAYSHTTFVGRGCAYSPLRWLSVVLKPNMPTREAVTSILRAHLFKNHLRPGMKPKQCELLTAVVLLQRNNARHNVASLKVETTGNRLFECLQHLPCSPDVTQWFLHRLAVQMGNERRVLLIGWRYEGCGGRVVTLTKYF